MDIESKKKEIADDIANNTVILYMKGSPIAPQCGFSAQVVGVLNDLGVRYETRDVLSDELLRSAIKDYSDWPTIPQLYVNQEFIGGCDIIMEMYASKDLQKLIF